MHQDLNRDHTPVSSRDVGATIVLGLAVWRLWK